MTAFTITAAQNIDELASKAGGDTYAVNGGVLTIDQDSRYGANQGTGSSLGSITISSTLGGTVEIDARYVRLIPFTSGSGTATVGATITCGGATGKVIGIYNGNAFVTPPVLTGVTDGWIKIKAWNGVAFPTSGTYTQGGYTFTISGADKVGFIEVVGDNSATATVPRLGLFRVRGDWFDVVTTSGLRAATHYVPTNGSAQYYPGVWVETDVASNVYEFYPNAGSLLSAGSVGTEAVRGKVCWISTAGVLRFGHDGTNADTGYLPPEGLRVRIPNVLMQNCTTAARTVNAVPNTTLATRYDFTTTGGGRIVMDKVLSAWYLSFARPYSVDLSYVGTLDQILLSSALSAITLDRVGVGMSAAVAAVALSCAYCYAGGSITNSVFSRYSLTASTSYGVAFSDCADFSFAQNKIFALNLRALSASSALNLQRCVDFSFLDTTVGSGSIEINNSGNLTFTNTTYFDPIKGTAATPATGSNGIFYATGNVKQLLIDGVSFGGLTDAHPPLANILYPAGAGNENLILRNVGSAAAPLSLGSVNPANVTSVSGGSRKIKLQRVFVSTPASYGVNAVTYTNSEITLENVNLGYATAAVGVAQNVMAKGLGAASISTSGSSLVGTIFADLFTSATVGKIQFAANDASAINAAYVVLSGGAAFTGSTGVYMPTIGMSATWELPYYALGHTALANALPTITGGTFSDYLVEFQIDKHDGVGFSSWVTASAENLSGVTGIDAALGFKLKVRITTVTTNTSAISLLSFNTVSTATAQTYQYPLGIATVSVDGLATGSIVKAAKVSDGTVLFVGTESAGAVLFTTDYAGAVSIEARKASASPYYRPWVSQITTIFEQTVSATAVQQLDE